MNGVQSRNGLYGFEFLQVDGRRAKGGRKTYEIKQLWQRSHEIINLAALGYKGVEIAEILNVTPETVSNTLNCELGELKLSEIRKERDEDVKKQAEKIRVLTNKALNVYHEIFDNEKGEVNLKEKGHFAEGFVKEISGLRAPTLIQSQSISTVLTAEELEAFRKRGLDAMKRNGAVDVESTTESKTEEKQTENRDVC